MASHPPTNKNGNVERTAEMPAQPSPTPHLPPKRVVNSRRVMLVAAFSFALGAVLRFGLEHGQIAGFPTLWGELDTADRIEAGIDIKDMRARHLLAPLYITDVLPFMVRNSNPKYIVLGCYILHANGAADKTKPVMVIVPAAAAGDVAAGKTMWVSGRLVMDYEDGWIEQALSTDELNDLRYISEHVNYWDRLTIWADSVREYSGDEE